MSDELLTWREAIQVFIHAGMSESTFRRRVKTGDIHPLSTGNRKKGALYPKREVFIAAKLDVPEKRDVQFVKVAPETMPEMVPVLESVFEGSPNVERWQSWMVANPDIAYMLKIDDRAVGVGLIVPLSQEKITSILVRQVTPPTDPSEILPYVPGMPVNLYVRSVGIIASATHAEKRRWAAILVRGFLKVIAELGARGIIIDRIYSRSETVDGIRILRHMGFTEIAGVTNHHDFMIDVPTSGLKIIKEYTACLDKWREAHGGE